MPKRDILPVENEHIILRLLERSDLPLTLSWRNQDDIRKWFINTDIISEESHYSWFERYRGLDNDFIFVILAKDLGNICVGQISLYGIDWEAGRAEFGRLMIGHPAARGKGYARRATQLVLKIGFERLELKEILLEVKDDNYPALDIYKSCGFIQTKKNKNIVTMVIKNSSNKFTSDLLTIIIPAYNEGEAIGKVLDMISKEANLKNAEIIVVEDASTDNTAWIVKHYPKVITIFHRINKGYGSSIVSGIKASTRNYVVWFDADGQHRVEDLLNVARKLIDDDLDYCIGVRSDDSFQDSNRILGKTVLKHVVNFVAKRKISDHNSGLRGFKKEVISRYLHLFPRRFGASTFTSLLMIEREYYGSEVPILVNKRIGKSSVKVIRDGLHTLIIILRLVLLFSPLQFWGGLGAFLIISGGVYGFTKMLIANQRLGFPIFASLVITLGVQSLFFGLLSDQVSHFRLERFEE